MMGLLKTLQLQLDVQQQHLNRVSSLVQQLADHCSLSASSSNARIENDWQTAVPSSLSSCSTLHPNPRVSRFGNAAVPPGSCGNQTSGDVPVTKVIYQQTALEPKTFSQLATAPLGGCGNQTSSSNMPGVISTYQQPAPWLKTFSQPATAPPGGCGNQTPLSNMPVAVSFYQQPYLHNLPTDHSLKASPVPGAVPPGASSSEFALVESLPAAPSRHSTTPNPHLGPTDGYSYNRLRPETICDEVLITSFSLANKAQEFPLWVNQFEEAVNICFNPHSQRRHFAYCLQWLPGSLDADAFSIWRECQHAKSDWVKLKEELEEKFEDPAERMDWLNNPYALKWDEENESLHIFASKVRRKVNTFDSQYADSEAARAPLYFTRFMNGMPKDYFRYLTLRLPSRCQSLEKALEISVQFQAYKRNLAHQ